MTGWAKAGLESGEEGKIRNRKFLLMGKPGLTQDRWVSCWHFIKLIIFKYLLCIYLVGVGETVY